MFKTWGGFAGFLFGLGLTVGLLLTPHLLPWGYRAGYSWSTGRILLTAVAGLLILAVALWTAGRLIAGATTWKSARVIIGAGMIAFVANALYSVLVEFFALGSGWRALVAVAGVPVIYGNLGAVLGRTSLRESMLNILTGALTTMGAGFIIAALIRAWS